MRNDGKNETKKTTVTELDNDEKQYVRETAAAQDNSRNQNGSYGSSVAAVASGTGNHNHAHSQYHQSETYLNNELSTGAKQ